MKSKVLRTVSGPTFAILALAASLLAMMVVLSATANAETPAVEINVAGEAENLTTLTIEGVGSRSVERDGTVARFSISVLDQSVRAAVSTGNSALADVHTALRMGCDDDHPEQLCVAEDRIQTTSIRISEQFDWTERGRVSLGFRYEYALLAHIDGVEQAGLLIDTIIGAGGDHVRFDSLDFTASGEARAERLALLDAIDDAQATAASIAKHMGYEIVHIAELTPIGAATPYPVAEARALAADEADFAPTPVFGGSESVISRVQMVFELRPLSEVADE